MPTSTSSHKRYVSLVNGTRQDASATLTNATMVMTARPEEGSHLFEDIINPTITALGRYDLILGKPWLTKVNPKPDWMFNTLTIQLPNGRYGVFQGITKTPSQEAHIANLDVNNFKQAVNEGVDHFYGFLNTITRKIWHFTALLPNLSRFRIHSHTNLQLPMIQLG